MYKKQILQLTDIGKEYQLKGVENSFNATLND